MVHPMSGAGQIKHDGSDADFLYEIKTAGKQFILSRADMKTLWKRAAQQNKTPAMVVDFSGYRAYIIVEREEG